MVVGAGLANYVAIANTSVTGAGLRAASSRPRRGKRPRGSAGHRGRSRRARHPRARHAGRRDGPRRAELHGAVRRGAGGSGQHRGRVPAKRLEEPDGHHAREDAYREAYFEEPLIVEPFRRADYALVSEARRALSSRRGSGRVIWRPRPCGSRPAKGSTRGATTMSSSLGPAWAWGSAGRRPSGRPRARRLRPGRHHDRRRGRPVRLRLLHQQRVDDARAVRLLRRGRGVGLVAETGLDLACTPPREHQRRAPVRSAPPRLRAHHRDGAPAPRGGGSPTAGEVVGAAWATPRGDSLVLTR